MHIRKSMCIFSKKGARIRIIYKNNLNNLNGNQCPAALKEKDKMNLIFYITQEQAEEKD